MPINPAAIDHTLLKQDCTAEQIQQLCLEANTFAFASVCVLPWWVELAASLYTNVCSVVGFPLGANTTQAKVAEAIELVQRGAREIDMVASVTALKSGHRESVQSDVTQVVQAVHEHGGIVKVIIETCLLTHDEKLVMCDVVSVAGADYIKTSTGFSTGGATTQDVALLRSRVAPHVLVKASGGIRDVATAQAMLDSGASRLGTSSGTSLL